MASDGGGSSSGGAEYYRILVSGISTGSNPETLLRTRFQNRFGHVIHVRSHPPTCAIVTLRCLPGQSHTVPHQLYSELGGSILTLHNMGTEKTTLTMNNLLPDAIQKLAELAPSYHVTCVQTGENTFHLSGLMDNVCNLHSEIDAFLLQLVQVSTSNFPQPSPNTPLHTSSSMSSHKTPPPPGWPSAPPSGVAAPQSSVPLHMQPAPFGGSSSHPHQQPTPTNATTTPSPVTSSFSAFNPNAPEPSTQPNPAPPPVAQPVYTSSTSIHHPPPPTTAPSTGKPQATTGHETYAIPPSSPTVASQPGGFGPDTATAPTHDPSSSSSQEPGSSPPPPEPGSSQPPEPGSSQPFPEPSSPLPPQEPGSPVDQETSNVFTNLNGDALALLERLPEGDIPGVRYNAKAGSVQIQLDQKSDVDDAISKFQDAYKSVALSRDRRLRVECVDVPVIRTKKQVQAQIAKFQQQYKFCAFVFEEEKRQVKVISQSRQFEQAKQFFRDALQEPQGASSSGSPAAEMVITLPSHRKLTLKKANIVEEEVDVIVNAANERLIHGGGVAGALDAASHGQLQKYCTRYMEQKRGGVTIPVGEVAVTHGGGDLKCNRVIHAVGPDSTRNSPSESKKLLQLAICNTLKAAEKHNALSIAIPALSCGIFGVSKELVTQTITNTILGFHFTKPLPTLSDIRIVIIDEPTHSCFAHYFAQLPQKATKGTAIQSSSAKGPIGATGHGKKDKHTEKDIPLSMDDLAWIMTILRNIAPKWRGVMMELGTSNDQVLSAMDSSVDPIVRLNMGLSRWLRQTSPIPTLGALARALSSKVVGEGEKASEIVKAGHQRKTQGQEDTSSSFSDVHYPKLPTEESMSGASGVGHSNNTNDHGTGAGKEGNTEPKLSSPHAKDGDACPICLEAFNNPTKTKCGHKFCSHCIQKALRYEPYCPSCKKPLRPITGKQPLGGTMNHKILPYSVPGYESYKTIQITYNIPSGTQGPEHPNPGHPYVGTSRVAYLPDNDEGRKVLQLLQKAFQARLIFTVGTSVTSGAQNVVVWNDIHHKTTISGGQQGYGYPDPTYLQRVKEDLAAKGIVPHSTAV